MKKSTLSTLIASLFTVVVAGSALAKAGHDEQAHEERKMIKIEMEHQNEGPVNIEIDVDGNHQVFEFTHDELNDPSAIEAKLDGVDESTRQSVMDALSNLNTTFDQTFIHHDGQMKEKKVIVLGDSEGLDSELIVELVGNGDFKEFHKIVKSHKSSGDKKDGPMVFKFSHGGDMKLHGDSKQSINVIKKLIKHSDLTQEQLDAIQQMIDQKR